jgi:TolB-like protein/class 3 adenylate cyclase/Flp pilus assembly protein TadD
MERRLAAILAADVVGYSRLMGEDEASTLSGIKSLRKALIEPKAHQYGGRIVKLMGDGALMEFSSAVDAVAFAVEVQCAMATRNAQIPTNRQIIYRIGINVGDIVIEDGDIFGDGVNVAARLEGLAEPNGICLARNVVNQVRDKLDLTMELVGKRKLKNISQAVTAYRVVLDDKAKALVSPVIRQADLGQRKTRLAVAALAAGLTVATAGILWWKLSAPGVQLSSSELVAIAPATKPIVAVLPFDNMSQDKTQEYFSDGMTEDLITDLSKVSGLFVIARNSTFAYKGKSPDIREIGRELNAGYVVEGSVRKAGGRVRINAQLVDARTGNHLWAERYDRDFKDVFELQDEVLGKIVEALRVTLTPNEQQKLAQHETDNAEAYDLYLQGLRQESFFTRDGNQESRRLFEQAITLDPNFALAYAHLAQAYSLAQEFGWTDEREKFAEKALNLAKKAVTLDDDLPAAHWALGRIYSRVPLRDHDRAISALRRVVDLDPNFADGYAFLSSSLGAIGQGKEALAMIEKAMRINPQFPFWYYFILGRSQFFLEQFEPAEKSFKEAAERNPTVSWPHYWLVATYGHLGRQTDAEWEISELESLGQSVTVKHVREETVVTDPTYLQLYLNGIRKAGVPEE